MQADRIDKTHRKTNVNAPRRQKLMKSMVRLDIEAFLILMALKQDSVNFCQN
jgi:hypothetical protein